MQLDRFSPPVLIRLLALASALVFTGLAHADDYSDVNQLLKSGKGTEALAKADKYLADKPKDPQMRFLKGVMLTESKREDEALQVFVALTQDYPELADPYNNLAVIYEQDGKPREAAGIFEKVMAFDYHYRDVAERLAAARKP